MVDRPNDAYLPLRTGYVRDCGESASCVIPFPLAMLPHHASFPNIVLQCSGTIAHQQCGKLGDLVQERPRPVPRPWLRRCSKDTPGNRRFVATIDTSSETYCKRA